ncbi:MAG: gamma-glutamyl-gamma-aminobutyrate hydrolase family protein [Alphaproteobacteria bacterium]|nr:gamma-glutamyl-gamma-aminobutyrate hydrolase family protein [Alphaproteobacteria bacterium]
MSGKPVIGVTTSARSGWRIFPLIALSIWLAGGRGRWFRVGHPAPLDEVDGLIVGGGDDISAELYGGQITMDARIDPERDALERNLISQARASGQPILGICRGAQMINVALGGSLHQDAFARYDDARRLWTILPRKKIEIVAGTRLAIIAGTEPAMVNALHSQSVDRVGSDLRVTARDTSGIVQAIESTDDQFIMGVQWHPEHLFYARRQRALFRALAVAARTYREGSTHTADAYIEQEIMQES